MSAEALLDLLSAGPRSVEALAAAMGCSPTDVAAALAALRSEGVDLADDVGSVSLVDPAGFGPSVLSWRSGRAVTFLEACASTNDVARQLAKADAAAMPVVVAEEQTAGRGRRGRQWQAIPGLDLTFSMVLRPAVAAEHAARAVLVWAAAMAEALDVRVKWPNDLVDGSGQKLGGLLAELELDGPRVRHVVLGVGLNVNRRIFPDLPGATSLCLLRGGEQDRAAVLGALVRAVDAVPTAWLETNAGLGLWRTRSDTLGRSVRVTGLDGEILAEGVASDLTGEGGLVVGGRTVLSGDVQLVAGLPSTG